MSSSFQATNNASVPYSGEPWWHLPSKPEKEIYQRRQKIWTHLRLFETGWLNQGTVQSRLVEKCQKFSSPEIGMSFELCTSVPGPYIDFSSIIFSGWTRSLDLIGHIFTEQHVGFLRIDDSYFDRERKAWGIPESSRCKFWWWRQVPVQEGKKSHDCKIHQFTRTRHQPREILNPTIANCVYILEPRLNGRFISRAIACAARLGQKNTIKVIRCIRLGPWKRWCSHWRYGMVNYWSGNGRCRDVHCSRRGKLHLRMLDGRTRILAKEQTPIGRSRMFQMNCIQAE